MHIKMIGQFLGGWEPAADAKFQSNEPRAFTPQFRFGSTLPSNALKGGPKHVALCCSDKKVVTGR